MNESPIRFHWSMSSAGEDLVGKNSRAERNGIPNLDAHIELCLKAERWGIESMLTAFGFHRADPIALATALCMHTTKIKFMVAVRSGICSPVLFVQQVNSVAALSNGRICLNVVGGHSPVEQQSYGDFLEHDERYQRTDEFLTVCRSLWQSPEPVSIKGRHYHIEAARLNTPFVTGEGVGPEIYVGGASKSAVDLANRHGSCMWTIPKAPDELLPIISPLLDHGTGAGLLVSLLARPTRDEALRDADKIIESLGSRSKKTHKDFAKKSDSKVFTSTLEMAERGSSQWVTPYLWTGAVPYLGAPAMAIVGSYDEVAEAIMTYKSIGISQFLFMGWPDLEEMERFGAEILPRVRNRERGIVNPSIQNAV